MVTNKDLFYHLVEDLDDLYVVTQAPEWTNTSVTITIDLDKKAAVLDTNQKRYPTQTYTVSDVRAGQSGGWLLSGGSVIFDEVGRIAVGLRNGNAADPFAYTNIAAGRCDRKFKDHCYQELASEFILCVKREKLGWQQANFGEGTVTLAKIREELQPIAQWKTYVSPAPLECKGARPPMRTDLPGVINVTVYWKDKRATLCEENLQGFALVDGQNHTVEFRLPVEIDLSSYDDSEIFYGEGTGYATWMFPTQIRELCGQVRHDGSCVVTPFLAWIAATLV